MIHVTKRLFKIPGIHNNQLDQIDKIKKLFKNYLTKSGYGVLFNYCK